MNHLASHSQDSAPSDELVTSSTQRITDSWQYNILVTFDAQNAIITIVLHHPLPIPCTSTSVVWTCQFLTAVRPRRGARSDNNIQGKPVASPLLLRRRRSLPSRGFPGNPQRRSCSARGRGQEEDDDDPEEQEQEQEQEEDSWRSAAGGSGEEEKRRRGEEEKRSGEVQYKLSGEVETIFSEDNDQREGSNLHRSLPIAELPEEIHYHNPVQEPS